MKINNFFDILGELYSPDFDDNGKRETPFLVKFYCQASTFSYEIFSEENAFHGKPEFQSEIFNFWNNEETMDEIIKDINKELSILSLYK